MNVDYDRHGNVRRYVRSCQPFHRCLHVTSSGVCRENRCCSQVPDRCLHRPGKESPGSFYTTFMLVFLSKTNVPVVNTLSDYMLMVIILQDIIAKTSD